MKPRTELSDSLQDLIAVHDISHRDLGQHVKKLRSNQSASLTILHQADQLDARIEALLLATDGTAGRGHPGVAPDSAPYLPGRRITYSKLVRQLRRVAELTIPPRKKVAVISKGDPDLVRLGRCVGSHFPLHANGDYAGFHPATSAVAIRQLERLSKTGVEYLLMPYTAFWWLDHYTALARYLNKCSRVYCGPECIIFRLDASSERRPGRTGRR